MNFRAFAIPYCSYMMMTANMKARLHFLLDLQYQLSLIHRYRNVVFVCEFNSVGCVMSDEYIYFVVAECVYVVRTDEFLLPPSTT